MSIVLEHFFGSHIFASVDIAQYTTAFFVYFTEVFLSFSKSHRQSALFFHRNFIDPAQTPSVYQVVDIPRKQGYYSAIDHLGTLVEVVYHLVQLIFRVDYQPKLQNLAAVFTDLA